MKARRDVLRILAVGGTAAAAWKLGLFGGRERGPITLTRVLMGTTVHLTVLGDDPDAARAAAEGALAHMAGLEGSLSRHTAASHVGRLNANGRIDDASDALLEVLALAERVGSLGEGAFDITIQPVLDVYGDHLKTRHDLPAEREIDAAMQAVGRSRLRVAGRTVEADPGTRITLDGVAKGYIVDQGTAALAASGFANVFVEAGGDLMAANGKDAGRPWRIGIRNPRPGMALVARFDATNRAVATSGDYMQPFTDDYSQHHILDPRTGRSSPELASSTVVAPDAAMADALATLTMVLGPRRGRDLIESLPGCEAYFVAKDLSVTRTEGFDLV